MIGPVTGGFGTGLGVTIGFGTGLGFTIGLGIGLATKSSLRFKIYNHMI